MTGDQRIELANVGYRNVMVHTAQTSCTPEISLRG